jgi:hypothetical protein
MQTDYRIWFAAMGLASVLVIWGFHTLGRRAANRRLLERGSRVQGEVIECTEEGNRSRRTTVVYRYLPAGAAAPLTVKRNMDGRVRLQRGQAVTVCYLPSHPFVSILVGHEARHDAS